MPALKEMNTKFLKEMWERDLSLEYLGYRRLMLDKKISKEDFYKVNNRRKGMKAIGVGG